MSTTSTARLLRPRRRRPVPGDAAPGGCLFEPLERRALLSAGPVVPDPAFGGDGFVTVDGLGLHDLGSAAAVQPDGKVLVAGQSRAPDASRNFRGLVARLNPDGSRDTGFDGDGVLVVELLDHIKSIALQPDGKILLGGDFWTRHDNGSDAFVVRLNPDGSVDTSFGTAGRSEPVNFSTWGEEFRRVAVAPDGKIVGVTLANYESDDHGDFGVARYNADGTLDRSFGGDGTVTTDFGHAEGLGIDVPDAIAFLPGGKTLVGGATLDYARDGEDARDGGFALASFNDDGSPDAAFGSGGLVATRFADGDPSDWVTWGRGWVHDLHVLPDGRFLAAGTSDQGAFTMARYKPDGSIDTSYGDNGFAVSEGTLYGYYRIAALADGNFAAAGASGTAVWVTVVDANGGVPGAASTNAKPTPHAAYNGVAFAADGDVVATGTSAPTAPDRGPDSNYEQWSNTVDLLVGRFSTGVGALAAPQQPPVDPQPGRERAAVRLFSGSRFVRGGDSYQFTLMFGPSVPRTSGTLSAAAVARLAEREVVVTGPDGFRAVAERVGVRTLRGGLWAIATYRITAPGGTFDAADNGAYAVRLGDTAVAGFRVEAPVTALSIAAARRRR